MTKQSHSKKKKSKDTKLRQKAEHYLWSEAMREIRPLGIGTVAMIVSSYSNQGMCKVY
jgi:hypothetical protein